MNSTGKQLGNMFSTTLLLPCKFLTTFIIFGYCAHRCAQVRTGAHKCAHTLFRHEFNWETTWKHVFHHFATSLQVFDNFHNFWILCAQVRTGAHKCAHTLFRHEFNWETTWKHVFHHFATSLQVFDNFHNFWILCAQVRTSAHTHYSHMNSTGKQLGNMFSTTLLLPYKFLTTFIIFGYCAHRCAQVRTHTIHT